MTNILSLLTLLLLLFASCSENEKIFDIPEGHVGMFGYGSLMSKNFIESGLLEKQYQGPFLKAHLKGYKRSWTFAWPSTLPALNTDGKFYKDYIIVDNDTIYPQNLMYMNIREDSNTEINGVLYTVPVTDLPTYDRWELGYERFEVTNLIRDYKIKGGPVYAYKALPDFVMEPDNDYRRNIIELSYAKILEDAFDFWGKEFRIEFIQSTETVDPIIIRENQKIPWKNPPMQKIEELKAKFNYTR